MKKELFDQLVQSLEQAVKIHRGEAKPSRQFVFKPQDVRKIRAPIPPVPPSRFAAGSRSRQR